MGDRYYLTTAIDYPLGRPHLGNALEKIGADVQARYRRMQGYDTRLILGADEHTVLVPRHAALAGIPVTAFLDRRAEEMGSAWHRLDVSYDRFVRTSAPEHERGCRLFLERLYDGGHLYRKRYTSLYCENCEQFKSPDELHDGCCVYHPTVRAREVREEGYFFALSTFRDALLELYEEHPDLIRPPSVQEEVVADVRRGLSDIAVTRQGVGWGHPAPFDPSQTIYVWVDALLSYVTAVGYGRDESAFRHWWPADMQVIGRDIVWFHGVLWPALLIAGGIEVPRRIQVHGLLLHDGEKMSKTVGNVVDALDLVDRVGLDAVRFFLLRACSFDADADFTRGRLGDLYEAELAGKLGRLFDWTSREWFGDAGGDSNELTDASSFAPRSIARLVEELHVHMERCEYDRALAEIVARLLDPAANLSDHARGLGRDARARRHASLVELVEALRALAIVLKPFMPATAARIYETFGFRRGFDALSLEDAAVPAAREAGAVANRPPPGEMRPLFPRLEIGQ